MPPKNFQIMQGYGEEKRELEKLLCPTEVLWTKFTRAHAEQAECNHGQDLQMLNSRGGLSPRELLCVIEGKSLRAGFTDAPLSEVVEKINAWLRDWRPPEDLDPEVRELCIALNSLEGIQTTNSCCGHGVRPLRIWFDVDFRRYPEGLRQLSRFLCNRYHNYAVPHAEPMRVGLHHSDTNPFLGFMLEGGTGDSAYQAGQELAAVIKANVEDRVPYYNVIKKGFI